VIDPAFLPAQKYPDPAGLTAREILQALRLAIEEGPPVVGFDNWLAWGRTSTSTASAPSWRRAAPSR
jgi:hypothetical protein